MNVETPQPSAAWRESCKKAIIPEVCAWLVFKSVCILLSVHAGCFQYTS